jgi:hypothetical protein
MNDERYRRQRRLSSRAEFHKVLRRAGYSTKQAESVLRDLPDPIDFDRDAPALLSRGVTLDRLINAVGGSP